MSERIRVGVIGLGYWGPNLARNIHALPNCQLRSVCDLDSNRLDHIHALYPEAKIERDFDALATDPDLDAIVIATPVRTHFALAKACLLAGKHVLIEKPLASNTSECDELIAIARQNRRILMTSHTFLYSPAIRKIKEIIESGDIGDIRYICARRLNLGIFQKDINVAWDLAPHDLSIILHILGEDPASLNCQGSAHITPGIEDVTAMSLQFPGGCSAIIHSSWLDPRKVREMTIVGSQRMVLYDDVATQEKIKIFDARVERPPHYDTFAEFHYAYHHGDMYVPFIQQEEPLKNECKHFIGCIISGDQPLTSGDDGANVVRLLEASSQSLSQNGAPVTIAPRPEPKEQETGNSPQGSPAGVRRQDTEARGQGTANTPAPTS